jgi:predicted DNA-binding transcriptional regulator AlpA
MTQTLQAMSVREFCQRVAISKSQFYRLKAAGTAPRISYVFSKPVITHAAAMEWLDALDRNGCLTVLPSKSA